MTNTTPELIFTDDLADLLGAVEEWLRRFIIFPNDHGPIAVALWVAFTHVVDAFDVAPYLLITAPEIESGKTKLMEVAAPLCHRPMFSSSMTPAVLFRTIDRDHPTLLLDEADNIWTGRKDDKATELVALLNAGHRRGVPARRMGGSGKTTLQEFDVFGPKAIAGAFPEVGNIPESLRSRAVHLRMQRKLQRKGSIDGLGRPGNGPLMRWKPFAISSLERWPTPTFAKFRSTRSRSCRTATSTFGKAYSLSQRSPVETGRVKPMTRRLPCAPPTEHRRSPTEFRCLETFERFGRARKPSCSHERFLRDFTSSRLDRGETSMGHRSQPAGLAVSLPHMPSNPGSRPIRAD